MKIATKDKRIVRLTPEQIKRVPVLRNVCEMAADLAADDADAEVPLSAVDSDTLETLLMLSEDQHLAVPTDRIVHAIHAADYLGMDDVLIPLYKKLKCAIRTADITRVADLLQA